MKSQTLVDIGNAHLDTVVDYTKKMVDANRIDAETAPSFINDLSDAMLETLNRFETVAQAASDASKAAGAAKKRGPKYAKTAKMREALSREGKALSSDTDLPPVAAAYRYVEQKRPVGRPRKDARPPVVSRQQRAFDKAFREKYPVLPGLTPENAIGHGEITVLFDGKRLKMIGRHLRTRYGLSFADYKRIYGLPDDYPSCAPGYAAERSRHARNQGLGTAKVPKRVVTPIHSAEGAEEPGEAAVA